MFEDRRAQSIVEYIVILAHAHQPGGRCFMANLRYPADQVQQCQHRNRIIAAGEKVRLR